MRAGLDAALCITAAARRSTAEPAATTSEDGEAAARTKVAATSPEQFETGVAGLFVGEVAQVRVWSSPCSEASLQRLVGRSGALEADATLVILWKADEGTGDVLRNSRPLQPPKPARGSKTVAGGGGGGTGAEGHAELAGEWAWIPCFDPEDYESDTAGTAAGGGDQGSAAVAPAVSGADFTGAIGTPSSSSSAAQRSGRPAEEGFGGLMEGAETDLARSLGWRSVSTAGDEEEDGEEDGEAGGASASAREKVGRRGSEARANSSVCTEAGANATAAGASAALTASAAIERADADGVGGARRLPPRDALLGLLGKLFRQCSVYLAPCEGDPLVESTPPPRGVRVEARVQLQLVRREERALRAIVQPEVCVYFVCRG